MEVLAPTREAWELIGCSGSARAECRAGAGRSARDGRLPGMKAAGTQTPADMASLSGAGDGNRTRVLSLGSRRSRPSNLGCTENAHVKSSVDRPLVTVRAL
jgi:hypothetical protein